MQLLLVYNPGAGGGRAARLLGRIRNRLSRLGVRIEVLETAGSAGEAPRLDPDRLRGFDGIVAVGGDGTVFGLVNALYGVEMAARPPLGVIPAGTGNAFARDLGLSPGDWAGAVDLLTERPLRRIDVVRVNCPQQRFHCVNVVGAGFVVDAGRTAQRLKRLGRSAYALAALWRIATLQTHRFRMEVDGRRIDGQGILVEVSNTRYTGTRFLIAPGAVADDGLIDLTLVRAVSRYRLLRLFPGVYSGRHVEQPEVEVVRAARVRLLEPQGLPMMADGEFVGSLPADIRCLPRDLEVIGRVPDRPVRPGPASGAVRADGSAQSDS